MSVFSASFEGSEINTGCLVLLIFFELDLFPRRRWDETTGVRRSIVRSVAAVSSMSIKRSPKSFERRPHRHRPQDLGGVLGQELCRVAIQKLDLLRREIPERTVAHRFGIGVAERLAEALFEAVPTRALGVFGEL